MQLLELGVFVFCFAPKCGPHVEYPVCMPFCLACQYEQSTKTKHYEGILQKGGCKIALLCLGVCVSWKSCVHFAVGGGGTGIVAVLKHSFHLMWSVPFLVDYSVGYSAELSLYRYNYFAAL